MIRVKDLSVVFGSGRTRVEAVRHVSFSVARGEAYGLVGESGSGKSTVLRAITRLIPDWTGTIEIDGTALGHKRDKATARRMQMVFQDPFGSLHPRHTVNDILREPLEIHRFDRHEPRILQSLADVGLDVGLKGWDKDG